ncbi:DUF484 family protein [Vibrio diazotrophicus]|uniref:DUF484 family protein n=1 Tax=Vibrio diazotrophicus TaxID=685 RepID=UPI00142DE9B9|nr:DUF484 family protein [Vibrio diazotrophicus]NIY91460.1 DUF484 family protein [Vibrio diazotrophicus]
MSQLEADALTAEVVAEYLKDNPDFFKHRPELVDRLSLPSQQSGSVSLVHVQMARQRQRIEDLEEEITSLMSLAASNDRTFHEFMDLQEQILKCECFADVCAMIEEKARTLNLIGYVRLLNSQDTKYSLSKEQWSRFSTNHFNGKSAYLGRLRKADRHLLFGEQVFGGKLVCEERFAPEMGSYVILPLVKRNPQGILAFASEDGGHFQPSMDTLFLRHLALVVSHLIETLPWQQESHERINTSFVN